MSPRKPARAHCEAVADTLDIPRPFNIRAFCETVAEQRRRPMLLQPLEGPADPEMPCGIWLGTESADLVFYAPEGEGILPTQIILHEIGHMLLGHTAPDLLLAEGASEDEVDSAAERLTWLMSRTDQSVVLPDGSQSVADVLRAQTAALRRGTAARRQLDSELGLATDRLVSLLARSSYSSLQERDAETLATIILERASRDETQTTSPSQAPLLARLNDSFGHPLRRRRS